MILLMAKPPKKVFKPADLEFGEEYQHMLDIMTRLVNTPHKMHKDEPSHKLRGKKAKVRAKRGGA
jgi:hypothetical protein